MIKFLYLKQNPPYFDLCIEKEKQKQKKLSHFLSNPSFSA